MNLLDLIKKYSEFVGILKANKISMTTKRRNVTLEFGKLKLNVLLLSFLDINISANYNPEDPGLLDLISYAIAEKKPRVLIILANVVGAVAQKKGSSYPCSSTYAEKFVDENGDEIEIVESIILWRRRRERCNRATLACCTYEETLLLVRDKKDRWYIMFDDGMHCGDVHETWSYEDIALLPLQPMKIRIVRKGIDVVCGPDGDTYEYEKVVGEYNFPPEMYER